MTKEFEERFVADRLLARAAQVQDKAVAEVAKFKTDCAPVLEGTGDEFLVVSSVQILGNALRDYMSEKSLSQEELFKTLVKKNEKGNISQGPFVAMLAGLPTELGRDDVKFNEVRQALIFKHLASDAEAGVSF